MLEKIRHFSIIFIGQFIGAVAFKLILLPNNLVAVGLGGVSTIINELTGLNIQLVLVILCLPILIWAFFMYERKQVYYAGLCFGLFTFYIGFVGDLLPEFITDPIIATIAGGVLLGISGGMVIKEGVPNGPEAIVGLYLKRKKGITVGNFFTIMNTTIIFSSIIYGELTLIVYSLIGTYISGKVTDMVILGMKKNYIVNIMSDNYLEITGFIHKDLHRGVTFIQSLDTNNVKKRMMIKTVVMNSELVRLRNFVKELEDDTFVYVTESIEVIGGGFSG